MCNYSGLTYFSRSSHTNNSRRGLYSSPSEARKEERRNETKYGTKVYKQFGRRVKEREKYYLKDSDKRIRKAEKDMRDNITIGIEGLVGSGKTSLCRALLKTIPNSIILHGGNLYRGIVFALINSGIDMSEMQKHSSERGHIDIKQMMDILKVELKIENRESVVYVNGIEINEDNLQSDKTSMAVSKIAKDADNSKFYIFGKKLIDIYKQKYNLIISGRDLMKIYPQLDYHFFITADLEERVNRKMKQYSNSKITREELRKHIEERDKLQEESGFYKRYDKTIDVDVTNCSSAEESAKKVLEHIVL